MRYIWQHTENIIGQYEGGIPLAHFLKNYFRINPKLGSRDRKMISEMCYCWYRAQKGLPDGLSFEESMKACLFICEISVPQVLSFLPAAWQEQKQADIDGRIRYLADTGIGFDLSRLAAFRPRLSEGITEQDWLRSMLQQPRLFIRLRRHAERTRNTLTAAHISFTDISENCLSLPNGTSVEKLLPPADYVVQDASSQATGNYFNPVGNQEWWDCCSGAGGKSLLLKDLEPTVRLTVSDRRPSILHNLAERFRLYRHTTPEQLVIDVTDEQQLTQRLGHRQFDRIICDVPCTGAGTWARTPEQLYFFPESAIEEFALKQKTIALHAAKRLNPGGRLIYITCSVFAAENEVVTATLQKEMGLKLLEQHLINGITIGADSMFLALLEK